MSNLYDAAKEVLANWERGDLAAPVTGELAVAISALTKAVKAHEEAFATNEEIQWANELFGSDVVNIDGDATTSRSGDGEGCWVSAWVWVYYPVAYELDDDTEGGDCD